MCVLAHPDDESLALGGTLAMYAAAGVETSLVMATRGERGWTGEAGAYPGPRALGRTREAELRGAARALGIRDLVFLDEIDGELDQADPRAVIARVVAEIRRFRPDVVVTFGPDGVYGHPDHVAISQLTTAAIVCAADTAYEGEGERRPHRVDKLYYRIWTAGERAVYEAVFGDVAIDVAGTRRAWVAWPDWLVTTQFDAADSWSTVREAVSCHRSQLGNGEAFAGMSAANHRRLWGPQQFYRAMSAVAVGAGMEDDLFAGLDSQPRLRRLRATGSDGTFDADGASLGRQESAA
jgi:LmbE family N-acetylglucosaminyl deacetylase